MKSITLQGIKGPNADLAALAHPLVLLSIAILLINDHVLKVFYPSWLTGKLSDFAGLFFFPILLGAFLNMAGRRFHSSPRRVALGTFGLSAFFFSLIKVFPLFNDLTEKLLSGLLSLPVQIVRDPSDLFALVMLLPAWKLRTDMEKQEGARVTKRSYIALGLASLATFATSPPLHPELQNLIVHDNVIYADFDHYDKTIFYSTDDIHVWTGINFNHPSEATANVPKEVIDSLGTFPELPVTVCLPDNPAVCYQTAERAILRSDDGGGTWSVDWSLSTDREKFLRRVRPYYSMGPYDLVVVTQVDKQIVVAAMGTEGILAKTDDGPWESIAVNGLGPIPYKATSFRQAADNVQPEINVISLAAMVFLLFHVFLNVNQRNATGYSLLKNSLFAATILFGALILLFLFFPFVNTFTGMLLYLAGTLLVLCLLASIVFLVQQLITNMNSGSNWKLILLAAAWLGSCAAFILWAYDMITAYENALYIAAILNTGYLLWLLYQLLRKVRE